ncbi:signal-transducing histidine kinase [Haloferax prahovense DSM 18310]|uniref:histidine kinase n=1 Tax=Haloferax prahovense (strain DSM 18310 / JCM 13924 / TL6) TaxID=1227461 RepID=M0G4A5_HALPT|nr:PAS domain-containing sensor histidine kinase [Haloferax prahovense]ELZ65634.1 signal-transducing histidine kinase [Haloferax prahovense DSM 18310]
MFETRHDETTVQLLVSGEQDQSAIRDLLLSEYDVVVDDEIQPASCYLIEDRLLPKYGSQLLAHKQAEHPTFCPVVVIKRQDSSFSLGGTQQVWQREQAVVDDIVAAPINEQVLNYRLENLCIRRVQSRKLTTQYEQIEARYERLFESAEEAIIVVDVESNEIVECNRAACELFGYSKFELQRLDPSGVIQFEDGCEFTEFTEHLSQQDAGVTKTLICTTQWGQSVHAEASAAAIEHAEQQSVLLLIRDISERVRRQKQIRVLNRVLRHNIRNSINVVSGYGELISESTADDDVSAFAAKVVDRSKELLDLSEKSRTVSNALQAGDELQSLDVVAVLDRIRAALSDEYPHARIELTAPESAHVFGNSYLQTALYELCENAIVHSTQDAPLVDISVTEAQSAVTVRIEDRGTGISEQELAMLEGEETALRHGSGLGLWMVNSVVDGIGGELDISTDSTRGSVVTVSLPQPAD